MHPSITHHLPALGSLCRAYDVTRLSLFGSAVRKHDFETLKSDADFLVAFNPRSTLGVKPTKVARAKTGNSYMASKVHKGFIARTPDNCDFSISHPSDPQLDCEKVKQEPSGILIHGDHRSGVYMNYAGFDDSAYTTFELPRDPDYLRDIANAIMMMADHIAKRSGQ